MGIESDQLVYDYLSRVGDAARQQQLASGDRMRLVSTLRNEIDRQRGKSGGDSPAAVRRILGRLGEPNAVVRAASSGGPGASAGSGDPGGYAPPPSPPPPASPSPSPSSSSSPGPVVPGQRGRRGGGWLSKAGRSGRGDRGDKAAGTDAGAQIPHQASGPSGASAVPGPRGPHLAGMDEVGSANGRTDWWRVEPGPMGNGPTGGGIGVPGFVGGVELPEILVPPPDPAKKAGAAGDGDEAVEAGSAGRRAWRALWRRRGADEAVGEAEEAEVVVAARPVRLSHPLLLLAAGLLVVGAFLGSWLALAGGWLLAYASRALPRAAAKWAVFGLPGVSVAGGLIWLWGRANDRWGEAIPEGGWNAAIADTAPAVIRTAAIASALYLLWRSRRQT
ncbi:hypothetical protein [Streptomyces liangshanensis]|uniref:Uncharacterized protein n=1 Tax=Streptomyces liangshanensis TaxID=2717324 RepID=A0A6G9H0Z3_9ACTN|nr:hypothetical protein [Streptomyces liangshanensis]QIQ04198.1 hypothetical protein HA039_19485 [Streptomyces liangshanensis]